jgi:glutathione S-transferase
VLLERRSAPRTASAKRCGSRRIEDAVGTDELRAAAAGRDAARATVSARASSTSSIDRPARAAARYQLQAALNFIATDVHAGSFGPLFNPAFAATKEAQLAKLSTKLAFLASHWLDGGKKHFLVGDEATVADLYAYIVTSWCPFVGAPDLATAHPVLAAYRARIAALPWVVEAHAAIAAASPKA